MSKTHPDGIAYCQQGIYRNQPPQLRITLNIPCAAIGLQAISQEYDCALLAILSTPRFHPLPPIAESSMKMLPSDPDIQTIYSRIRNGDLDLQPNFQRGEVWTTAKKRKLIDSVLREWHVPPIHVVVGHLGRQEVLDGQQRLAAIRDFIEGRLTVDGGAEPFDEGISSLDDLLYDELPQALHSQRMATLTR